MKIIFAGTPDFALPAFHALLHSEHVICAVYTREDRPAGRGLHLCISPIKEAALNAGLPVIQPVSLKVEAAKEQLRLFAADILVDVACGILLPNDVLEIPRLGCINIHPSLLPRWRGAAPIQRAILAGDSKTGVTIMRMDEGLDTGDILKQIEIEIDNHDTALTLEKKLAKLGANLLLEVLKDLKNDTLEAVKQDNAKSCYAEKISKEDAFIDWNKSAIEIDYMVRAFNPRPIAFAKIKDQVIRIFKAIPILENHNTSTQPGNIIQSNKDGIDVATGSGIIRLLEIQLPGGKVLPVSEVLKSRKELFS